MQSFLLGLFILIAGLLLAQGFTTSNPSVLSRRMKLAGGGLALAFSVLFLLKGLVAPASLLGMLGVWLLGWKGGGSWGPWTLGGGPSPGRTSRVTTDHLEMELDLDTGAISGRVLKGMFAGRDIESLKPVEMALLWQDCQFTDPKSAQIIEAYLDRVHPTWREDMARGEREIHSGPDGRMSREEAFEILGLAPGASEDEIRRAHRELILKLHPDRGGSTYLASKINEAKDVLLGA